MDNLLIDACLRGRQSRTRRLAEELWKRLPGDKKETLLYEEKLYPLDRKTYEMKEKLLLEKKYDDPYFKLANEFKEAKRLVIAAPLYDMLYPAILKDYIESITQNGLVFGYDELGNPSRMCKCEIVYYVTTSGGYIKDDVGYRNIQDVFGYLFGVKEFRYLKAEGLDIVGNDPEKILKEAIAKIPAILP